MTKTVLLALTLGSFLTTSGPAWAASDAERVKGFMDRLYAHQKQQLGQQMGKVQETGTMTIKDQGKYFNVSYPALTFEQNGVIMALGPIQMNVMPGDKPTEWKATIAVPSPIKFTNTKTKEVVNFVMGTQSMSAIIDDATLFPRMMNVQYKDVSISEAGDAKEKLAVTIGDIGVKAEYAEVGPGLLSGPFNFAVNNIKVEEVKAGEKAPSTLQVGSFVIEGQVDKLDMAMIETFDTKMKELNEGGFDPDKVTTPQSMDALWKIVMEYGVGQMDGIQANISAKDIRFTEVESEGKPMSVSIDEAGYGIDTSGWRGDKSRGDFSFVLKMKDWSVDGLTAPELKRYMPEDMNIRFGYKDLPHRALMQQLGALASAGVGMDAKGSDAKANMQMIGMQAMMSVPALLANAGTVFTINDTKIKSGDYDVRADGTFTASSNAIYGGAGSAKVVFTGLDQIATDLQAMASKSGAAPDVTTQATKILQGLSAIQMFGQQGTGADGKPARIYDFFLDDKGAVKLNGTDMSALMGGGGAAVPEPEPVVPTTTP